MSWLLQGVSARCIGLYGNQEALMVQILNAKKVGTEREGAVYVGRPSKWGNPFIIPRDGNRTQVIAKFRSYLLLNQPLYDKLSELKGKDLICWCAPMECHAEILAEFANG
jgi:hypothetical protein